MYKSTKAFTSYLWVTILHKIYLLHKIITTINIICALCKYVSMKQNKIFTFN